MDTGAKKFIRSLLPADWQTLCEIKARASEAPPGGLVAFFLGDTAIGHVDAERARLIARHLPGALLDGNGLRWDLAEQSVSGRTEALGRLADFFHKEGLISGWRCEAYECCYPQSALSGAPRVLFSLERAAFRFFGLQSQAVHINGFDPEGRMWCGRRSLDKATDPGRLDNLAAGGLTAGETILSCARRELAEEAGLCVPDCGLPEQAGVIVTSRLEPEGWHNEILWVFNLEMPKAARPVNRDGEVSEFLHLDAESVMHRLRAGDYSIDAGCVLAQGLLHQYQRMMGQPFSTAI